MKEDIDKQLQSRNIKPTAMRHLGLKVLTDQTTAIGLPELENKFDWGLKVGAFIPLNVVIKER